MEHQRSLLALEIVSKQTLLTRVFQSQLTVFMIQGYHQQVNCKQTQVCKHHLPIFQSSRKTSECTLWFLISRLEVSLSGPEISAFFSQYGVSDWNLPTSWSISLLKKCCSQRAFLFRWGSWGLLKSPFSDLDSTIIDLWLDHLTPAELIFNERSSSLLLYKFLFVFNNQRKPNTLHQISVCSIVPHTIKHHFLAMLFFYFVAFLLKMRNSECYISKPKPLQERSYSIIVDISEVLESALRMTSHKIRSDPETSELTRSCPM